MKAISSVDGKACFRKRFARRECVYGHSSDEFLTVCRGRCTLSKTACAVANGSSSRRAIAILVMQVLNK